MVVTGVNFFQYRIPFRGLPEIFILKVGLENFFNGLVIFRLRHFHLGSKDKHTKVSSNYYNLLAPNQLLFGSKRVTLVIPLICVRLRIRCSNCSVSLTNTMMDPSKIPSLLPMVMERIFSLNSWDITVVILLISPTSSIPTICRPVRKANSFWEVHLALMIRYP